MHDILTGKCPEDRFEKGVLIVVAHDVEIMNKVAGAAGFDGITRFPEFKIGENELIYASILRGYQEVNRRDRLFDFGLPRSPQMLLLLLESVAFLYRRFPDVPISIRDEISLTVQAICGIDPGSYNDLRHSVLFTLPNWLFERKMELLREEQSRSLLTDRPLTFGQDLEAAYSRILSFFQPGFISYSTPENLAEAFLNSEPPLTPEP